VLPGELVLDNRLSCQKKPMCGPLRPPPVRAEHEVETSGSRVIIAVSNIDKRRKPHRNTSGTGKTGVFKSLSTYLLRPLCEIATLCSITWGARDRQARFYSVNAKNQGRSVSFRFYLQTIFAPPM